MLLALRNIRILTNLARIKKNSIQDVIHTRYLRGLPRQTVEFKALSSPGEDEKPLSDVELAEKELAQLTGGMNVEQLKELFQKNKKEKTTKSLQTTNEIPQELQVTDKEEKKPLLPTYSLAAYVDKSELLKQFIKLGVDLSAIERRKGLPEFILKLEMEKDVLPRLMFLKDQGVPSDYMGEFITKNPLIFKVDVDDLQTRINYLEAKRFTQLQIQRIITINPFWLMFSTQRIDKRLGYFQQEFALKGDDVRFLCTKQPRLITYKMEHIEKATFCIREEMGFNKDEIRCLLLNKPRLWMMNPDELIERFAYAHKEMKLSHQMLLQQPEVLTSREFRLRERHEFLKMLGRAQYDPEKDMYLSPKSLVEGNNHYFVRKIAKSDMETYDLFLRTR